MMGHGRDLRATGLVVGQRRSVNARAVFVLIMVVVALTTVSFGCTFTGTGAGTGVLATDAGGDEEDADAK
jgi:hypothetical protein